MLVQSNVDVIHPKEKLMAIGPYEFGFY